MLKLILSVAVAMSTFSAVAAELSLDFSQASLDTTPSNYISTVSGMGKPGNWKVIEDAVPSQFAPLSPNAQQQGKRRVLAQLSQDSTDEHFPLLIYNGETFGDFTLTTRFKCVSGSKEQMAGIAFRIQDEQNYYVVRASALGNTFRFYKFVAGQRSQPIGPEISIPAGVWHELGISCTANQIRCSLNGKEVIPALTDNSFPAGKVGFWTKSDSVSYFTDTRISFTHREPLAQKVVRQIMEKFPKLIGLKIIAHKSPGDLRVIASNNEEEIGTKGSESDANVIKDEQVYCAKGKSTITVIVPLRDRNGETVAALSVRMKSFPGQTESNALARALPINQEVSARIQSQKDLYQ
jgi:hypothetical protein